MTPEYMCMSISRQPTSTERNHIVKDREPRSDWPVCQHYTDAMPKAEARRDSSPAFPAPNQKMADNYLATSLSVYRKFPLNYELTRQGTFGIILEVHKHR